MGQPVAVVEKPTPRPGVVRLEANRSLTGMGHERFTAPEQAVGPRTAAELARRLFATGRVDSVHVYQNVVTVDLKKGYSSDGLARVLEDLYIYWVPGREVPPLEMPVEEAAAPTASDSGGAPAAGAVSAAASRVPAHLLERSRQAKEKAAAAKAAGAG
jgi:Scaffold protein Nfu/NifU N terminal